MKRVYDDMQLADLHAFLFQEKVPFKTIAVVDFLISKNIIFSGRYNHLC